MVKSIDVLKHQARALHKQAKLAEPAALGRVRALPELRGHDAEALVALLKRRHCLSVVARELGFEGWPDAVAVLSGRSAEHFGTMLYPDGASAHWNIWSASYEEARSIRAEHGGYLLAYKRHYFIADRYFVETLGLDPDDADWQRIGRDWVRPDALDARDRLCSQLIQRLGERA